MAQLMACSCKKVLRRHGVRTQVKWPNDLLLNGKKVAGILCETIFSTYGVDLFLGLGLNVNWEDPSSVDQPATSLYLETHQLWDKEALLKELQLEFATDLEVFKTQGFAPFQAIIS
jgi:BirA family biotin operon repressor/biotin-[acetyl-CoA-carboxylase] ligase